MPNDARLDRVREVVGFGLSQRSELSEAEQNFMDIVAAADRAAQPELDRLRRAYAETQAHASEIVVR